MTRRHTKRDLARILKARDIRANRLLGQNFLIDHNILDFICEAGELSANDVVLEIGSGTGLLTEHLVRSGARVVAIEIDRRLFEISREYIGDAENVLMRCCDVHGKRRRLNPDVEAALAEAMEPGRRLKVVSNLPYCISSDLLVSLLEMTWDVERMVVTVQKEFADRLLARPGSRDYGPLTVLVRARARVLWLKSLPPSVFWPVPRIASSIIQITPDAERSARIADLLRFKSVVTALFSQRRKTAAKALQLMPRGKLSKDRAAAALRAAGVSPDARADGLRVAEVVALANAIAQEA